MDHVATILVYGTGESNLCSWESSEIETHGPNADWNSEVYMYQMDNKQERKVDI